MNFEKYKILKECNKIQCLECGKFIKGTNVYNIKRHYKGVHKKDLTIHTGKESSDDDIALPPCSKKAKVSNNIMDKNSFLKCCVGLVTVKNLPFRIFDDDEFFKSLIMPYEQKFKTNLNSRNIVTAIKSTSEKIESIIKKKIIYKMVCLKLDIATRAEKSILGINIQYIKDFKICINTIGMVQLQKRHTAAYIKEEIMKCLKKYGIDLNQIYSTTTDNGANVVKVGKMLQEEQEEMMLNETSDSEMATHPDDDDHIHSTIESVLSVVRCAAHTIQLAAYDVIKTLKTELDNCRETAKKVRSSIRAGGSHLKMAVLDNATRWNSAFDMVKSLADMKEELESTCAEDDGSFDEITWDFISEFVAAFTPLLKCTKALQTEQYILGDFYRDWLTCELELQQLFSKTSLAQKLHDAMEKRKKLLLANDAFTSALYLDPRFNFQNTPFITDDQKNRAVAHLFKTFDVMKVVEKLPSTPESPLSGMVPDALRCQNVLTEPPTAFNLLESLSTQMMATTPATAETERTIKQKLIFLSSCKKVPFDTDVLKYWKHAQDCDLKKIAETALAVPATQVSVERAFSALSLIITKWRSKLKSDTINSLLVTKLNFPEISCKAIEITVNE